jgi:hypothetical protein
MSIKNILTLVINHHYYTNSCCNNYVIQADPFTKKFLEKNRMAVRYIKNTWKLFTDVDNESLWVPLEFEDDMISLKFELSSSDETFYKSINDSNRIDGVSCICNKKEELTIDGIQCSQKECKQWKQKILQTGNMYWTICLNFKKSTFLSNEHLYNIVFNVKNVFWKYIVFHHNEQENIEIVDPDSRVGFTLDSKELFPNEKKAVTFLSDSKMPLSETDEHNFRLIVKKGSIEKCLIKRLPIATPAGVQYKDSEKKELVSLIFINT